MGDFIFVCTPPLYRKKGTPEDWRDYRTLQLKKVNQYNKYEQKN